MEKTGLYTEISCSCTGLRDGFYRLYAEFQDKTVPLCLLVRNGTKYIAHRKLPTKCLGSGEPVFHVVHEAEEKTLQNRKLCPGEAVPQLEGLRTASLRILNGEVYLRFN